MKFETYEVNDDGNRIDFEYAGGLKELLIDIGMFHWVEVDVNERKRAINFDNMTEIFEVSEEVE